jgi:dipeptidyl-peptidase III
MIIYYGQELVTRILTPLHVWKCTANSKDAREFVNKYSAVNEHFLKIKKIIDDFKIPRRLELNHNIFIDEDMTVIIEEYPETMEGIIKSFVNR